MRPEKKRGERCAVVIPSQTENNLSKRTGPGRSSTVVHLLSRVGENNCGCDVLHRKVNKRGQQHERLNACVRCSDEKNQENIGIGRGQINRRWKTKLVTRAAAKSVFEFPWRQRGTIQSSSTSSKYKRVATNQVKGKPKRFHRYKGNEKAGILFFVWFVVVLLEY